MNYFDKTSISEPMNQATDYEVKLEIFQGPLDLLLHLIRKNEVDIFDIPMATITEQYLEYLDLMKALNITIAGDFLVMASTLIHIKSMVKMRWDHKGYKKSLSFCMLFLFQGINKKI